HLDRHVGLHYEDVLSVGSILHRRRWRHDGVGLLTQSKREVHELPGPERLVRIWKLALELDRPRGHVRAVVDEAQPADDALPAGIRGVRLDPELSFGLVFADRAQVLLRDRKRREYGHDLIRSEEHTSELQSPDHLVCRL